MSDDYEARRRRLRTTLKAHEAAEAEETKREQRSAVAGYAAAFRLSTEFVSALFVGGVIGWGLDWVAGTSPLFLIVFFLLGFVAGVLNVLRSAGLIRTPEAGKNPPGGA